MASPATPASASARTDVPPTPPSSQPFPASTAIPAAAVTLKPATPPLAPLCAAARCRRWRQRRRSHPLRSQATRETDTQAT
eukprot:936432-Pleurochrysis_carterae.AAC.2